MKSKLAVNPIRTRVFELNEPLIPFLINNLELLASSIDLEAQILAITSKIISLSEGRILCREGVEKRELIRSEADLFLGEIGYGCFLTVKEGLLIASAGIDESNADGDFYILYPQKPYATARKIQEKLSAHFGLNRFGVLITDSHTSPLRVGVNGVSLAHSGFKGVDNRIDSTDLFGQKLKMTQVNVADALAAAAVVCMGEGAESQPLALVSAPVIFRPSDQDIPNECRVPPEEDLYWPFIQKRI